MSTAPNTIFSQQTGHKYTFQLELKKLNISPSLPFEVKIVWARGQQRIQSQNIIKLQPPENQVTLQECFCNKSTVLYNPKKRQFRKKQSKIQIILYANGSPKQGGQHLLNLCEIIDPFNIKKMQQRTFRVVTRQQKPRCELQFKLTAEYCQEMVRDQQRSIGSGVASISSKNTTSMAMVSDQKNYIEKKNLFLYEAPSKDNQSVASYTSYNTGIMRYGSNKKQRDDSVSMKKQEYGITKRESGDNFFNKTTNVKSNISQDYDTKSKGGYNRYTQQNYDNKTQNFDQNINKQLQDEQTKRSKLQAELSRLNIYMKQQSNKLTEYITDNTKLKEQLNRMNNEHQHTIPALQSAKHQFEQTINKLKKQNGDLHNRAFQLNNENRQLHRKLDNFSHQLQTNEQNLRRIKMEKQRAQTKFEALNRNMEGIISTKQITSKQVENLRDELEHIKSLNINLRQNLQKQRRKVDQLQYNSQYQLTNIEESHKKKQQRLHQIQRQNSSILSQLRQREKQIQGKKDVLYRLEKTNEQYKTKIIQNQNEKSQMFQQNKYLKSQVQRVKKQINHLNESLLRVRDDKTAEYEQKNTQLESSNYQYQQRIRALQYEIEQNKKNSSQILAINDTFKRDAEDRKNQIYRLQTNLKGLKQFQTKFYTVDKLYADKQREISYQKQQKSKLFSKINELQDYCRKLTLDLDETRKKVKQNPHPDVDVNQILRESVQMQVQLKFKTDQLLRLKPIEQKYEQIKYRLQIQQKNKHEIENDIQKLQKQLKDKNKLYLIEVEKGKIMLRQRIQSDRYLEETKSEIKRCQEIIYNGDKQVKQMEAHIRYLQSQNRKLVEKLQTTQRQLSAAKIKANDTSRFETKIKQLEKQLNEKIYTVNLLTNNLSSLQKKIYDLENQIRNHQSQIDEVRRSGQTASQKMIELQQTKNAVSSQLQRILNEKKSVEIKCEMIMQELHALKKQFQDQKGRSTSIVSMRSSEEQAKIRQLQNELEKKDKTISKLTKEKLQIEEENINLHVQVMKKLSEMQKTKDLSQIISSEKLLNTPK